VSFASSPQFSPFEAFFVAVNVNAPDIVLFWSCPRSFRMKQNRKVNMNWTIMTYLTYLLISVWLTVWVARTLHKNGRIFLVDSFLGNDGLADSVNHLLVVGFYLINIGYVTLALRYGAAAENAQSALEQLSTKIGLVLLVLGAMHFFNLAVFSRMRRRGLSQKPTPPVIA
jgi:hypothetical protein